MGVVIRLKSQVSSIPTHRLEERLQQKRQQSVTDLSMLKALDEELWTTGIHIAAIGSSINHLAGCEVSLGRAVLQRWIPSNLVALPHVAVILAERAEIAEPQVNFRRLADRLDEAKRLLAANLGQPSDNAPRVSRDELEGSWQSTAGAALICLYDRDRLTEFFDLASEMRPIEPLADLLVQVRDGGAPLLAGAELQIPAWARLRKHRRLLLNQTGTLKWRGGSRSIRIIDVSRSGFGIDFADGLPVDAIVSIVTETGRRFLGRIAWCRGGRAGVEFASELCPCDALISPG